jgi:hypothetical protein
MVRFCPATLRDFVFPSVLCQASERGAANEDTMSQEGNCTLSAKA